MTRVPGRQLVIAVVATSVRVAMVKLFHIFISSRPRGDSVNPQLTNEKVQAWRSQASYPGSDNQELSWYSRLTYLLLHYTMLP